MSGKNSASQFKDTYGASSTFTGGMIPPFSVGIVGLDPKHPAYMKDLDVPLDDWNADLWDQARLNQAMKDPVPPEAILILGGVRHTIKVTNRRGTVLCVDGRRTIIGSRLAVMKQKAQKVRLEEWIEIPAVVDKNKDLDVSVRLANSGRRDDPPWVKAENAAYLKGRGKEDKVIRAVLDNCDQHTLRNYYAYVNVIPEIRALVENEDLPKDQRIPFKVAVEIGTLGEGEMKRQKLAVDYMRASGLRLTGESGQANAAAVVKGILDGTITKVPTGAPKVPPASSPGSSPAPQNIPAAASTQPSTKSGPSPESKPQDKAPKTREPREHVPGLIVNRAMKPKHVALVLAHLEPTGDEPLETEAGRGVWAALQVITGADPTGEGLKDYPEVLAAFRKVLPSPAVTQ